MKQTKLHRKIISNFSDEIAPSILSSRVAWDGDGSQRVQFNLALFTWVATGAIL